MRTRTRRVAVGAGLAIGLAAGAWSAARRRGRARINWTAPGGRTRTGSLAARSLGDSGPPVLLLHGLTGSGRYWGGAYDAIGERAQLVVPDLLGFGASPRPPAGYGVEDHCDALAACLAEHGVDEPVVVAGHSLGSLLAIALAARRPELVRGVVGLSPPIFRTPADARRRVARLGITARLFALPGPVAHRTCKWMCGHRDAAAVVARLWRPGLPPTIARDGVQHSWVSYSQTMRRVILDAAAPGWLPATRCPVMLVAGARDPVTDVALLDDLAVRHANVTTEVWSGGDHDLPLSHPERCVACILDMIKMTEPPDRRPGSSRREAAHPPAQDSR
jgi:pimeloyl-ACP methyl ester carboxylesterase